MSSSSMPIKISSSTTRMRRAAAREPVDIVAVLHSEQQLALSVSLAGGSRDGLGCLSHAHGRGSSGNRAPIHPVWAGSDLSRAKKILRGAKKNSSDPGTGADRLRCKHV